MSKKGLTWDTPKEYQKGHLEKWPHRGSLKKKKICRITKGKHAFEVISETRSSIFKDHILTDMKCRCGKLEMLFTKVDSHAKTV